MSEVFSNFLGNIVLSITNLLFVRIITKEKIKCNKKIILIILLIMILYHTIIVYFFEGILRTLLTFIFYIIVHKLLFNINWKRSIF